MSGLLSEGTSTGRFAWPRVYFWSVRRELWEYRSITWAPIAVGSAVMVALVIGGLRARAALLHTDFHGQGQDIVAGMFAIFGVLLMVAGIFVGASYALGTLFNERKDRTILFWKSLPVSNGITILAKVSVPLAVLPAVVVLMSLVMQVCAVVLFSIALMGSGHDVSVFWGRYNVLKQMKGILFDGLTMSVWCAPFYAWLMLVSGWARRAPALWAFGLPIAVIVFERLALGTTYIAGILRNWLSSAAIPISVTVPCDAGKTCATVTQGPWNLESPQFWAGMLIAAALFAVIVIQRRRAEPI